MNENNESTPTIQPLADMEPLTEEQRLANGSMTEDEAADLIFGPDVI